MDNKEALLQLFNKHDLPYELHEHEALFTVAQGKHVSEKIRGAHSKNLFLRDKKGSFFLISILEYKRVDLKTFSKIVGKGGLSFATESELLSKLHLSPGAVTPYALMYDPECEVIFILDEDFLKFEIVNFHPMRNDLTLSMHLEPFLRFFKIINHVPKIMRIPVPQRDR